MSKPTLTFTLDRTIDTSSDPIRLAVTLNAWTSRVQAEVDEKDVQHVFAEASRLIGRAVFGEPIAAAAKEECRICRFWQADWDDGEGDRANRGMCLRRAPGRSESGAAPVWPVVYDNHWCGEFERKAS